jgi:alpha-ketoglutarate-dependent taurine dioxygenase
MKDPDPKNEPLKKSWISQRKAVRPKAIGFAQEELINTEFLARGQTLPLVIQPTLPRLSLSSWAVNNREFIQTNCLKYGAILFRNFDVDGAAAFEQTIEAISGKAMEYRERSSPRSRVQGNIYTSTDYPAEQTIFPHNEHSYALTLPLKLYFCCLLPAQQGGETPLADTRKIFARLDSRIKDRFIEKKWMYVRNFGDGFGLDWQTVFQTTDRATVEEHCRSGGIEYEWKAGNRLRTRQVRPAVARHPRTGEMVWFNHATFFHVSTLDPSIRDGLLSEFRREDLPNNTYYGDETEIEPSVLDELRTAYMEECVAFEWKRGDVVLLDNMLTAHARRHFFGPRKVVFGMAEPYTRIDVDVLQNSSIASSL